MTKYITADDKIFREFVEELRDVGWGLEPEWENYLSEAVITNGRDRVHAKTVGLRIMFTPFPGSSLGDLIQYYQLAPVPEGDK